MQGNQKLSSVCIGEECGRDIHRVFCYEEEG